MDNFENWEKKYDKSGACYYETFNECGCFRCDEKGLLVFFEADNQNSMYDGPHGWRHGGLRNLIIPEGVIRIGTHGHNWDLALRGLVVMGKLGLPGSLEEIGPGVFSESLIGELELPDSLRGIEAGALMHCYIHVLRLPERLRHPECHLCWTPKSEAYLRTQGRQFKETIIDTLIAPEGYPYKVLMLEAEVSHIQFFAGVQQMESI